ncbi:MAG TPA: M48 family metallopeptidase [Solirubrobacter sp.]|nr:M48 family metallopeptidase [Solirubrobacter sp.]
MAVVAAAAVAALLVVVMAPPADQLIEPVPVRASDYFSAEQIERGRDFRRPQLYIGLAALATQIALLAYLAKRPPERLRSAGARWWHGAVAGAAIAVAQSVVVLPFTIVNRIRAIDVGLNTRSWPGWAWDWVLSVSINAVLMGLLAVALLWLMRCLPKWWWAPGTAVVVIVAVGWTLLSPVVLDPLFNRFEPLRAEPLRSQVLELARKAGVDASEVQVMDASRRTTGANAYVAGLGHTKRIVLYDNLLKDFKRPEQLNIVAHELGHEHYGDLRRGLLYVAIVAPFGMLAVALLTRRLTPGTGPVVLPALALSILLVTTGITWISNTLSRKVEARADAFALRITNDPDTLISLQKRLVIRNVSDPEPPGWVTTVFGTHPPPMERIGSAVRQRELGPRAGCCDTPGTGS